MSVSTQMWVYHTSKRRLLEARRFVSRYHMQHSAAHLSTGRPGMHSPAMHDVGEKPRDSSRDGSSSPTWAAPGEDATGAPGVKNPQGEGWPGLVPVDGQRLVGMGKKLRPPPRPTKPGQDSISVAVHPWSPWVWGTTSELVVMTVHATKALTHSSIGRHGNP